MKDAGVVLRGKLASPSRNLGLMTLLTMARDRSGSVWLPASATAQPSGMPAFAASDNPLSPRARRRCDGGLLGRH